MKELKTDKLFTSLRQLVKLAEEIGVDAKENPEAYEGTEVYEISDQLEQIYNALMTGDRNNDLYADELFKK